MEDTRRHHRVLLQDIDDDVRARSFHHFWLGRSISLVGDQFTTIVL